MLTYLLARGCINEILLEFVYRTYRVTTNIQHDFLGLTEILRLREALASSTINLHRRSFEKLIVL